MKGFAPSQVEKQQLVQTCWQAKSGPLHSWATHGQIPQAGRTASARGRSAVVKRTQLDAGSDWPFPTEARCDRISMLEIWETPVDSEIHARMLAGLEHSVVGETLVEL